MGGRGHGVDGRVNQNARRDYTYYIARRTNTTWRNKSRPLGFGWGGERGMVWMGVGIKIRTQTWWRVRVKLPKPKMWKRSDRLKFVFAPFSFSEVITTLWQVNEKYWRFICFFEGDNSFPRSLSETQGNLGSWSIRTFRIAGWTSRFRTNFQKGRTRTQKMLYDFG